MRALVDLLPAEAISEQGDGERWSALGGEPEAVVHPESTDEVSRILSWANEEGVGIVPAGTGAHLGTRQMHGRFVILSTERLTGIEIYEPADLTLTAKAGTKLSALAGELSPHRQWLPFDPPDSESRTLGGLVSAGVSGSLWAGYGELRNHVLGATAVCGDGLVLRLGGRVVKNVAGFDLLRAVVGSRGTLAVLTSVCVRLFPVPEIDRLLVLRADSLTDLVEAARGAATAPILPASAVLIQPAGEIGGGATLMLRLHGAEATVNAEQAKLERHLRVEFEQVHGDRVQAFTRSARDQASQAPFVVRVAVLPSHLAEVVSLLGRAPFADVAVDAYGGAVRIGLGPGEVDFLPELRREVESLGGTVGMEKLPAGMDPAPLVSERSREELDLTERLQRVFDPRGALWRQQ